MTKENRTLGCFRLLDEVGKGSQDAVYKAVCERDGFEGVPVGMTVALKVLTVSGGEKCWLAEFQARVEELKRLAHPGVARCFGYFIESGPFCDMHVLVTEWLEGETLKDRLRRTPQGLGADEVLRIGEQLLSALGYVSSKRVVHRNIKPGHVFLCANGSVKVVDFRMPQPEEVVVPPERNKNAIFDYMAPDLVDPKFRGDEQSDIFSVGACLHEMLTGRLPYRLADGRSTDENKTLEFLSRWHCVNGGDDSIKINPLVNRLLAGASDVLAKALRPKREERYATFADFAAAFEGIRYRELTHGGNTWRLLQYVGRGGFSEVFKARDVKTGKVVAIKRFLRSYYANRFRREARVLSSLNDSSIVRFVSFFEKEMGGCKQAFLVMEYLDGMPEKTLRDELRAAGGKSLPRDLLIRAFARYAHGLSVLHSKGFVHRDIRPAKLYFPTDAIGRAVIMGLGIGVIEDSSVSETPPVANLDYLPPEVVDGSSRGDAGMDIYALGLSLYEALSGKMAYSRLPTGTGGFRELFERATNKVRPNLDESFYSDLPDLVWLVREMTEPDVTKRLKDSAEVERRLGALLSENVTVDYRVDDPDPQTLYAAPSYALSCEKVEFESNDDEASTIDDGPYWNWNSDEGKKALARQRRKQRLVQMCSYLLKGLVIMAALLVLSGAFVGLFWLCETCIGDSALELKSSLSVRVLGLFPWLFALVWTEAKTGRMPNRLTFGCLLTGVGVSALADGVSLLSLIGAAAVGAAVLLPFFLIRAVCAGTVKMFAAAMTFWGVRYVPFTFAALLCMGLPVCLVAGPLRRSFVKCGDHAVPSSPIVLLSMLSLAVALWFWNGHGMLGGYIFMVGTLVLAAVARLLFRERKQHAEVVSTPSSACAAETATPHADFNVDDARTVTTTGSESHGLLDATCRDSDDLVSETEGGTGNPSAFLNLHGHATVHGFRLDPSPLVAEGGQGRVFKAECVEEGRLGLRKGTVVALKFVEETDQSPSFEEFEKAVAYLREIKSPHVPRYYGCFRVERRVNGKTKRFRMTVMEYLDGADLGYRVKVRSPNFYADEIMYVLDQLLEGLCDLSAAGIVHRDIKPSNVFICRDGTVKLIDFDTALIRGIDLFPKNRKIVGTPEFAAPDYLTEGFWGDEISDVFSVGMTLYYMVHGVSPHRAKGIVDGRMGIDDFCIFWHNRLLHHDERWNKTLDDSMSHGQMPLLGLDRLLNRSLSVDRKHRYIGFKEFRLSLQNVGFRTVQYEGRLLRIVSQVIETYAARWNSRGFGGGEWYANWCGVYGRDESGVLHKIPLEAVMEKSRIVRLWMRLRNGLTSDGMSCVTEKCDFQAVAGMRKAFAEIKTIEQWEKEERDNELFPLT